MGLISHFEVLGTATQVYLPEYRGRETFSPSSCPLSFQEGWYPCFYARKFLTEQELMSKRCLLANPQLGSLAQVSSSPNGRARISMYHEPPPPQLPLEISSYVTKSSDLVSVKVACVSFHAITLRVEEKGREFFMLSFYLPLSLSHVQMVLSCQPTSP